MMPLDSSREAVSDLGNICVAKLIEAAEGLVRRGQHDAATVLFRAAMAADSGVDAQLAFAESFCRREEFRLAATHFLAVLSNLHAAEAPEAVAAVCNNLAVCYRGLGEFERAAVWQQQSIRCEQADGLRPVDPPRLACDLTNRACDAMAAGDFPLAKSLLLQSLAIERRRGAVSEQAADLGNLGIVALLTGRFTEARRLLWQSYRLHRRLDDACGCACDLVHLAEVWRRSGHSDREFACLERALSLLPCSGADVPLRRIRDRLDANRRARERGCASPLLDGPVDV